MTENQLAERPQTQMERVRSYILSPEVKERFSDMMGEGGLYYLNQVLMLVANNTKLQECTPQSILIAAGRAASLRLSLDPAQGQAWIIPYAKVATYQTGYKGIYELAMRTREYRFINVFPVFDGEWLEEDRFTGIHALKGDRTAEMRPVGYCLYFELINGFKKTFYMTVAEIIDHAETYSQGYRKADSPWNSRDGREREKMMKKTVLSNGLRKWGVFNPADMTTLEQIEQDQGFIDYKSLPDESEVTPPPATEKHTESENMKALGFDEEVPPPQASKTAPAIPDYIDLVKSAWPQEGKVSWEIASGVVNSDEVAYVSLSRKDLGGRKIGIDRKLAKPELTDDERAECELKRDVIDTLLALGAVK